MWSIRRFVQEIVFAVPTFQAGNRSVPSCVWYLFLRVFVVVLRGRLRDVLVGHCGCG